MSDNLQEKYDALVRQYSEAWTRVGAARREERKELKVKSEELERTILGPIPERIREMYREEGRREMLDELNAGGYLDTSYYERSE